MTVRRSAWGACVVVAAAAVLQPRAAARAVAAGVGYAEAVVLYSLYYAEVWAVVALLLAVVWRLCLAKAWRGWRLCRAAGRGAADQVARLLAAGVGPADYKDVVSGGTPLHFASAAGHAATVRLLVDAGGPELALTRLNNGCTSLHLAAENGHAPAVRELLAAVPSAHTQRADWLTACAANGMSCLHLPARRGELAVVRLLVNAGGQQLVRLADNQGNTALHLAARSGHVDVAQLLLDACGNPSLQNGAGHTGVLASGIIALCARNPALRSSPSLRAPAWAPAPHANSSD